MAGQKGAHLQLHLASLNRCASLVQRHLSPADLAVPDGRYASFEIDLKSSFAFANLFVSRLKPAKTDFQRAVEYLKLQQGHSWPSGKVALYLLYGLATTHHREQDTEKAMATLEKVLGLALNIFEKDDPRVAEIHARAKAVAERANSNLRHHKAVLLARTAGDGQKLRRELQYPDTQPPRAEGSSSRRLPELENLFDITNHRLERLLKRRAEGSTSGHLDEVEDLLHIALIIDRLFKLRAEGSTGERLDEVEVLLNMTKHQLEHIVGKYRSEAL